MPFERITIFSNGYPKPFERMTTFFKRIAQAVRTDDNFFQTDIPSRSNGCHSDNFFQTDSPSRFERMTIFLGQIPRAVNILFKC